MRSSLFFQFACASTVEVQQTLSEGDISLLYSNPLTPLGIAANYCRRTV